ncbi:MAG: flavin reductase domain protein FMN-binding protein [Capsulimonas sp.]|nr:flavin reductase domain protein FMN-binding protein [Capsulimonas sp.]
MQFDLTGADSANAYRLLTSTVVPRPIALVTSIDTNGSINAAPFSFFNMVGSSPPVIALGVANRGAGIAKETRANIEREGEFVVNLVDEALAEAMNICAIDFPDGVSELPQAGLTASASITIRTPRIAEAPVSLECRIHSIFPIGDNRIVLAEVVHLYIRNEFVDLERMHVRTENLKLIGRMHGGGWYARTTDLFDMPRIPYNDWLSEQQ